MARWYRIYGKKRGDRRTGSQSWGSAGEALFFGFFVALGGGTLIWLLLSWILPEWRVYHGFAQTEAVVLGKTIDGEQGRPPESLNADGLRRYRPQIHIRYQVDGRPLESWTYDIAGGYYANRDEAQAIIDQFQAGQATVAWYDPVEPTTVVLVRGVSWGLWVALLAPASFIVIGGGGLIRSLFLWGRSAEQRSADLRRVAELNPLQESESALLLPHVPHAANLTNSPGTTLAYRLPTSASPGLRVFTLGASGVIWNGVVLTLLVLHLTGRVAAEPAWPVWMVFAAAVPVGWYLVYLFVRLLLLTSGVGPTLVEISDHPLLPGERFEVFLSQTGKLALNTMQLDLECEEEATYRQGTDTRTDRRRVYQKALWRREQFDIEQGLPFEVRCELRLPSEAMHSFKAMYNGVHWRLVVRADIAGWPKFERVFSIVVHPAKPGAARS